VGLGEGLYVGPPPLPPYLQRVWNTFDVYPLGHSVHISAPSTDIVFNRQGLHSPKIISAYDPALQGLHLFLLREGTLPDLHVLHLSRATSA
jgi:hypothetical protein